MEIMDKVVGVEPEVETDSMKKVNQKLAEAGQHLACGLSKAVEAISLWSRTVLAPALEEFGRECRKLAKAFGECGLGSAALELLRKMEEERALI